jgi:glyoxylase-like metal-dependent hydrolase (beta-lactamase superfamily II)
VRASSKKGKRRTREVAIATACPQVAVRAANVAYVSPLPSEAERLQSLGVQRLRAENPSLLTMSGTNTWVVGRDPAWVVDPGPALISHQQALNAAISQRGGLGGIVLTHDHIDHSEGVEALREHFPAPLAAARGAAEIELEDGARVGPFEAIYAPGHAPDHFVFIAGGVCFAGDAVLGEGSVFIAPDPGALTGYLQALRRLRELELQLLCPGHGPPVWAPRKRLDEYIEHRLDRERRLVQALAEGRRSTDELLDAAWSDVPKALRPLAAVSLAAHLDKLGEEGRLPLPFAR